MRLYPRGGAWEKSEKAKKNPEGNQASVLSWKELGDRFLINKETAQRIVRTYQETGRTESKPPPGRPRLSTPRQDLVIVYASDCDPRGKPW